MESVSLDLIDDNPFNSRVKYDDAEVRRLAESLEQSGQLAPVKLRTSGIRFQIVYGHRRVRAARLLSWRVVMAEVGRFSDEEMLEQSIVENIERVNLSDYEKALAIKRMHDKFGKTYSEIGGILGFSQEHVSNFVRMTRILDVETLASDLVAQRSLYEISEHHARILLQLSSYEARRRALVLAVSERLSVRELQKVINRLRSWFDSDQSGKIKYDGRAGAFNLAELAEESKSDINHIHDLVTRTCRVTRDIDFSDYLNFYAFRRGFSFYDDFPPFQKFEKSDAVKRKKDWFYSVSSDLLVKIGDMQIRFIDRIALVTLSVEYKNEIKNTNMRSVATIVLERSDENWRIIHEHWSRADLDRELKISA